MSSTIVHKGCIGTAAIPKAHIYLASGGRTLRASKWTAGSIEAPTSGKASFGVRKIPPALAQARAEGVRE